MTREIPRTEWPEFFDTFSRAHDTWLVAVEVMNAEVGDQIEGRDLRFRGIVAEPKLPHNQLSIMLETSGGSHLSHFVDKPAHVWLESTSEGADEALQIEDANHTRTLMRFRSAVRPETVDGLVHGERRGADA